MIQAIVFLPLLGAILAGIISLVGAHARCPGGDTVEHHDDGHGHGRTPTGEAAGVIHASTHEPDGHDDHGHDDHHVSEPAAWGSRPAELITTGLLFVSAVLSWVVFVDVSHLERSHGATIAAPFVLKCQSACQCQPPEAPGYEVQGLARSDPVFEHAEQDEPAPHDESEQDAFLLPARVPSVLALALTWLVFAKHVGFRPGSGLTVFGHCLPSSCRDASDQLLEAPEELLS